MKEIINWENVKRNNVLKFMNINPDNCSSKSSDSDIIGMTLYKHSSIRITQSRIFKRMKVNKLGIAYTDFDEINDWNQYLKEEINRFSYRLFHPDPMIYKAKLNDFEFLKVIGHGGFASVVLAKLKITDIYLAVKILSKIKLTSKEKLHGESNEKQILQALNFPFAISLEFYFQDDLNIYFALPFIMGGDLFRQLKKKDHFDEDDVKFYSAQIVLTLEYLHNLNIVYRDLKPENILIDHTGYLKVSDFGISKIVTTRTYSFTGTPEYIAPEMLVQNGYGKAIDWWALGVLIYELTSGLSPFASRNISNIMTKISHCVYVMPSYFSNSLKDLLSKLIIADLSKRYGNLKGGADDVKNHQWFKTTDWIKLLNHQVEPPSKPHLVSAVDTKYFETSEFKKEILNMNKSNKSHHSYEVSN